VRKYVRKAIGSKFVALHLLNLDFCIPSYPHWVRQSNYRKVIGIASRAVFANYLSIG